MSASIVWFRRDLRLRDNPALAAACARGGPIVPVFVLDDTLPGWRAGAAARWWLDGSLRALDRDLSALGSRLILRRGPVLREIADLAASTGASAVYWNRCYDPWSRDRDTQLKQSLRHGGIVADSFNASLLAEPCEIRTGAGRPFQVFTPFWRACRAAIDLPPPHAPASSLTAPPQWPPSDPIERWALQPSKPDWAGGLRDAWTPGEQGALGRLDTLLDTALPDYPRRRDQPAIDGTSRLSPHLAAGDIGPRQIWRATRARAAAAGGSLDAAADKFLSEIGWREFCIHIAFHSEDLSTINFRREFDRFPWRHDPAALRAWQKGLTGYPIVDAGMRELWTTGWMHNRVRMIVASFLVKHLLIDWREGESWFRDTLVDADFASNAANWQWVAGSGADATPYFRIFNPVLQGEKFDAAGAYVRRWVPEIAALPDAVLHKPWTADAPTLAAAGIRPGVTYPSPIVDHTFARKRALESLAAMREANNG